MSTKPPIRWKLIDNGIGHLHIEAPHGKILAKMQNRRIAALAFRKHVYAPNPEAVLMAAAPELLEMVETLKGVVARQGAALLEAVAYVENTAGCIKSQAMDGYYGTEAAIQMCRGTHNDMSAAVQSANELVARVQLPK